MISGKSARYTVVGYCDRYVAIGSILGTANSRTTVWGSGFIIEGETVQEPPKAIHAVRGPLTRAALLKAGINCPEVYGDPALLLPRFFNPDVGKQFQIGIIPHFLDKSHPWIQKHQNNPDVLIIDVQGNIWEFVRAVKSCQVVLSSSLHGLICADAYGVSNVWIQLSDRVIGGNFKFYDYRLSIGAGEPVPIRVSTDTSLDAIAGMEELPELKIDLRKLLLACPFLSSKAQAAMESGKPTTCGLPDQLVIP
jgi:pyruvyltransferase